MNGNKSANRIHSLNSENHNTEFGTGEGEFKMAYSAMIQEAKNIGLN